MSKPWEILYGDVRKVLKQLSDTSFDGVLTDPPYGLSFMGKRWDYSVPSASVWNEVLRVLRPGAHALIFGGTRTFHRLAVNVEDGGFELRDTLMYLHGVGFPKGARVDNELFKGTKRCLSNASASYVEQVSPAIRLKFATTEESIVVASARIQPEGLLVLLTQIGAADGSNALTAISVSTSDAESIASNTTLSWSRASVEDLNDMSRSTIGTVSEMTTDSKTWNLLIGLLTFASTMPSNATLPSGPPWPACSVVYVSSDGALKHAPIPVLSVLGSATANPLVGWSGYNLALKPAFEPVILARKFLEGTVAENVTKWGVGGLAIDASRIGEEERVNPSASPSGMWSSFSGSEKDGRPPVGRWPANVILDEEAGAMLDAQTGNRPSTPYRANVAQGVSGVGAAMPKKSAGGYSDNGGPSRFFYTAKVSKAERERGCEDLPHRSAGECTKPNEDVYEDGRVAAGLNSPRAGANRGSGSRNHHPTLKPIDLCRYLAGLILPPKTGRPRRLLIPYAGSGSEIIGALQAGWDEVVGIEREAEYIEILEQRIRKGGVYSKLMGKVSLTKRERERRNGGGTRTGDSRGTKPE